MHELTVPELKTGYAHPRDFTVRVPTLVLWGEKDRALLPSILVNAQIRRFIE